MFPIRAYLKENKKTRPRSYARKKKVDEKIEGIAYLIKNRDKTRPEYVKFRVSNNPIKTIVEEKL